MSTKRLQTDQDGRIILHFDYDCFYAQVVENQQPALRAQPLGVRQKSILATCNYEARRRGVSKLMSVAEARRACPDLVLVDGEDLTPFRDVSKRLYALLRRFAASWSGRAERLGLDEIFLDVTDLVAYNAELLNRHALAESFFCLSRNDPEHGFVYDASAFSGCVHDGSGSVSGHVRDDLLGDALYVRLLVASHLGRHLRLKLEEDGFTSACGISTNKLLAKMVGGKNKPRNQTTLLALRDEDVFSFVDEHKLRKLPGIGSRITRILEGHVLGKDPRPDVLSMECAVTAGDVRNHPGMSLPLLEKLLGGPGIQRGTGAKVWGFLHGVDAAEVKPASDLPVQISIEDTYAGLNSADEIARELRRLAGSLIRRMHTDLLVFVDEENNTSGSNSSSSNNCSHNYLDGRSPTPRERHKQQTAKWAARPKSLRLTTRPKTSAAENRPYNWGRASRSGPLPTFVFALGAVAPSREALAARLAAEALLPMFRALHAGTGGWNVGLLNVCVTNMVVVAGVGGEDAGRGRDIVGMFRRQGDVRREFTVYDGGGDGGGDGGDAESEAEQEFDPLDTSDYVEDDDDKEKVHLYHMPGNPTEDDTAEAGTRQLITTKSQKEEILQDSAPPDPDSGISWDDGGDDDDSPSRLGGGGGTMETCSLCGHLMPLFALSAHERFHRLADAEAEQ